MINIFDSAVPETREFFKFANVGDSIQGTYVDQREDVDSYGNEQVIYVLKIEGDKFINVGIKKFTRKGDVNRLVSKMEHVKIGQIIGFRFEAELEPRRAGDNKTKIIKAYDDPNIIDKEWLETRVKNISGDTNIDDLTNEISSHFVTDVKATPVEPAIPSTKSIPIDDKSDYMEPVRNLAVSQGLVTIEMTNEEKDKKIQEFTGIDLSENNTAQIIIKLISFKK